MAETVTHNNTEIARVESLTKAAQAGTKAAEAQIPSSLAEAETARSCLKALNIDKGLNATLPPVCNEYIEKLRKTDSTPKK